MSIRFKLMKSFLLLISFLIGIMPAFSQIEMDRNDQYLLFQKNPLQGRNDSTSSLINLAGGYHLNSNVFTNDFFRKGFIDDDTKSRQEKRLKNVNRVGMDVNMGITAMIRGKKLMYVVALNNREMLNAKFSHDDF